MYSSSLPGRINSYHNRDYFFQKLLYEINGKKVINIIAEKLNEKIFSKSVSRVTVSNTHTGIYFKYPDLGVKMNNGREIRLEDFHLTFHTFDPHKPMNNKLHFSFIIGNTKYIYPLIQTGNLLSKKPLNKNKNEIGGSIVYKNFNSNINQIIDTTLNIIKKNLDLAEIKIEENNKNRKRKRNIEIQQAAENKKAEEIERKKQENERREAERAKLTEIFYTGILGSEDSINNTPLKINSSKKAIPWVPLTKNQIEARRLRLSSSKNNKKLSSNSILGKRKNINKNGGSKQKNKLNSIKTKYLLQYCKKNNLKGYSEYNKKDLINFIKNNVTKKLT
jgi:hypothetical protein